MKLLFKLKLFVFLTLYSTLCKRVSEKGLDCVLPFTYNGQIYSDCAYSSIKFIKFPLNFIISLRGISKRVVFP